jgi:thiol-disulfide isomerase/thioredoxin
MQRSLLHRLSHPAHRKLRLTVFSIAAGLSLALLFALIGARTEAKPKIGKLPKDSVANHQIRTLDGETYSLAGLRGKVVVLDFFAVWCGYSRQHIPTLTKYGAAERERGLQIIGLAVDDAESTPERVRKFIAEMKIAYPVGMVSDADFSNYVESKDVSVPQTLIYSRNGRLVAHFNGHDEAVASGLTTTIMRELEKH